MVLIVLALFQRMAPNNHKFRKYKNRGRKAQRIRDWLQEKSNKRPLGGKGKITAGYWNVRNLVSVEKQETVVNLLDQSGLDILCLSESWFREDCKEHEFSHRGYKVIRNDRSGNARRGVAFYCLLKNLLKLLAIFPKLKVNLMLLALKEYGPCLLVQAKRLQ